MRRFKPHNKVVYNLAFAPNGKYLLSSAGDERVVLWSLESDAQAAEWPGSPIMSPIAFSPDGLYMGTGGYSIRVWRMDLPQTPAADTMPVIESNEHANSCGFSVDGTVFAAFGSENPILRWQMPSGERLDGGWGGTRLSNGGARFPVGGMAFHPGGSLVANCFGVFSGKRFDSVIHLWDCISGTLIDTMALASGPAHPKKIAFSPDGNLLAAETGPVLHVWNMQSRGEVAKLTLGKKHVQDFAFSSDGATLLAIDSGTAIRGWSTADWKENEPMEMQIGKLTAIAVASDGRVAVGNALGRIAIWSP